MDRDLVAETARSNELLPVSLKKGSREQPAQTVPLASRTALKAVLRKSLIYTLTYRPDGHGVILIKMRMENDHWCQTSRWDGIGFMHVKLAM